MVHAIKFMKLALWYLLWPFAAAYDLVRDRTHEKPGWWLAAGVGGLLFLLLVDVLVNAGPDSQKWTLFVCLAIAYLVLANGFRFQVREQNLWEF